MRSILAKILVFTLLAGIFCVYPSSAAGNYTLTVSPSGVQKLRIGETVRLTASVKPVNLMEHVIYWSSENEYVASVSSSGVVTAKAAGTTTVTAAIESGATARVTITVAGNAVRMLKILNPDIELEVGGQALLTYEMNEDADDKRVLWSSDDTSIAKVDQNGLVTAVGTGTAIITLLAVNGTTSTARVFVPSDVKNVAIYPEELLIAPGDTYALDAYVFPGNARNRTLTWETDNASVARVDENGVVTAVGKGECHLKASTANGVSAQVKVTSTLMPTELSLSQNLAVLSRTSRTVLLEANVKPNGVDGEFSWSSSNESVAIVRDGLVCATGYGRTRITVHAIGGLSCSCDVYVCDPPTDVRFENDAYSLSVTGDPVPLELEFSPANSYGIITGWKSDDPSIASVDESGVLTPHRYGSTRITVTCLGGLTASANVKVYEEAHALYFTQNSFTLPLFSSHELSVVSQTGDRVETGLTWTSDNTGVCAVVDGMLYTRAPGTALITVKGTDEKLKAQCTVKVSGTLPAQRPSIALTFDNGPGEYTSEILNVLNGFGIRATFFLLGENIEKYPKIAELYANTPHEIGNHTLRNTSLNTMSFADIATQIERTDTLIEMTTGRRATILRAPDANLSVKLFTTFLDTRFFAGWSADTGDAQKTLTAREIADRALSESFDTAILVFHDAGSETAEALRLLIPELIRQGYDFVTVSDLIQITGNTNAVFTTKKGDR